MVEEGVFIFELWFMIYSNIHTWRLMKCIPSHTSQSGQHKQIHKQMLERMRRKGNPSALLVGMQTGAATVENSMEFPQKTKNGTAF